MLYEVITSIFIPSISNPHSVITSYSIHYTKLYENYSDIFSLEAALVLCANGIKTYLFTSLRATPVLSYAVRKLKTDTGIMVTASHNPAEYNGYKVYWNDGAQVTPPYDSGIINEVNKVTTDIKTMDKDEAISKRNNFV